MATKKVRRPRPAGTTPADPSLDTPILIRHSGAMQLSRPEAKAPPIVKPRRSMEEELREEYAYVLQDLQRVFLLAFFILILLVILNLVI